MHDHREIIDNSIVDKHTRLYPNHTIYTHMGCVLLRTALGLILINSSNPQVRQVILIIIVMSLIVFGFKYMKTRNERLWKIYPRMLLAYSTALYLILQKQEKYAGALIIADALMGVQARHLASVLL